MARKNGHKEIPPFTEVTPVMEETFLPEVKPLASEVPVSLLYEFTNAAAAVVEVQPLMAHFFNILRSEIDFDIGAYLLDHEENTEGRIFKRNDLDDSKFNYFSELFLKRASKFAPNFYKDKLSSIGVSILMDRDSEGIDSAERTGAAHSLELPLKCFGEPSGVITLISFKKRNPFEKAEFTELVIQHATTVIERILTQKNDLAQKLGVVLGSINDGIFVVENDGTLTSANPKGINIVSEFCKNHVDCIDNSFGLGETLPDSTSTCGYVGFLNSIKNLDPGGQREPYTKEVTNEDGLTLSLSADILKAGHGPTCSITVKDVTEEKQLEKSVMLSSKLASLGEMAAGIAHEINNPLQTILGNIEMLEINVKGKEHDRVERVKDGVLRIRGIIKDLLTFARDQSDETDAVDINTAIRKALDISAHQLKGTDVSIVSKLDSKPLMTPCNPNLLQQVIINLIQNARDAIVEARKGKTITVKTGLLPNKLLGIEVSDDGPGIPEAIMGRIFDPLFTTKEVGKGTGLGLSLSKKIIEGFGGKINVASTRRMGTTFRITLPYGTESSVTDKSSISGNIVEFSKLVGKSVLMVDDEDELLNTTSALIAKNVFKFDTASSGSEALNMIDKTNYDFILLDIRMPEMDGKELFKKITSLRPSLKEKVIFITADADDPQTAKFLKLTQCHFLSKPFDLKDLLIAMREIDEVTDRPVKLQVL